MCLTTNCNCVICEPLRNLICLECHEKGMNNILLECDKCLTSFKIEIKRLKRLKRLEDLCGDCKYKKIYDLVKDDSDIEDMCSDNISQRISGFSIIYDDD